MPEKINYLSFNHGFKSLSVGTVNGWKIFSVEQQREYEKLHEDEVGGGIRILELAMSTSLAAVVECSSPRKLLIINISTKKEICNLYFSSSILSVRLSRLRLVVVLEDKIFINNLPKLDTKAQIIHLKCPNPAGLGELCGDAEDSLLVYPTAADSGIISVYDCARNVHIRDIAAHASSIACMAVNSEGSLIATASEKGTLIRIFSLQDGSKQYEFRRGVLRNAAIASMVFSPDDKFLAISSDTETMHIFKLNPIQKPVQREDDSWFGWLRSSLPTPVTEILNEERAFATINKVSTYKSILGFQASSSGASSVMDEYKLLVASYDGYLYVYEFDPEIGGECRLKRQHLFVQVPPLASPKSELKGAGRATQNLTDSSFSVGRLPDLFNQVGVGYDYTYGLYQSVVGAGQSFLDTAGITGGTSNRAPACVEQREHAD